MLKLCKINACPNGTLGIHLSRAPYDPYPWVSGVLENSSAYQSGIKIGDTVLECNGIDVLGWKISELAIKIRNHWDCGGKTVNFLIWRSKNDVTTSTINQQSLQKFATCLQNIAQLLECPICLEVIKPPGWQCCNGHVLCNSCRNRSVKCPVCRVPFGPRGRCLLSDKLFTLLAETFPCDGTKNGSNKNGRCPPENIKNKKCNISKKITSIESPLPSVTQTLTEMRNPLVNTSNENNSITTFGTTRIIKVGEEVRTSPIKTRNNQNTYDRIPQELTTTTIPAIPSTTFQTRSIETNHQPLIVNRKYLEPIQNISTTATTTTALLPHTTIVPLSPVLSTTITTNIIEKIEPLPMHMTNNISCMSSGSTEIAVNSNLKGSTENKLEKQIITLKVKSKSSENLNFFRVEKETKELEERKVKETLSLPASPVSNLVNSKKNSKITTKMSPGYET
ncbi:uncharacterized protein LOC129611837 isoform X2 [Condylostylus longicornis]|nr:uncharacterized protein LOC129611837 isoform X2 [Condylostylus longicornis]